MSATSIYETAFQQQLFDEMSATYGVVNLVASFGFAARWRRQCLEHAQLAPGLVVCDLMSGMGECWPTIVSRVGPEGRVVAIDFSPKMCERARGQLARLGPQVSLRQEDATASSMPNASADRIVCSFGLKTMSHEQIARLAAEIRRILKPGGKFSCIEISRPKRWLLAPLYLFYLRHVIPWIGRCFLGNPDNYRMLGVYTCAFESCARLVELFEAARLRVDFHEFFFGCATGLSGVRES
jgi:demethylmenaquinone methyltransferase/2-methoxy-6-polyprenyl-1,4-benzoquinol methylase